MNNETALLLKAVKEAGQAIVDLQRSGFTVSQKENSDLLTQADLLANEILKNQLTKQFPNDGWLSEESCDDARRLTCERVWIVDPIDGTKEFVHGIPEFAISVALVEKGEPILACVFNPIKDELYYAIKGGGAWLGDRRLNLSAAAKHSGPLLLLASRSECQRGEWDEFKKIHQVKEVGSIAYKLALVAAGEAHATFSLGPKHEWDIAAGVLLVTEAGGLATDKLKKPFTFNQTKVKVNGIVATSAEINESIFAMVNELPFKKK